ncbi:MAG: hypothetical protein M3Z04_09700 [Chloroflexota bacterium]|nr:hypothetical protein [Chloroflexota bacterium]
MVRHPAPASSPVRLFAAKLRVPLAPPRLVSRPRLLASLATVPTRKLTLVLAPAGFGKTTLVAEYARSLGAAAAWLTLEPGDADLVVFGHYLIAAISRARPVFGRAARTWLEAAGNPALQLQDFAAVLVEDLEASGPDELVVILDDFHEVAASGSILTLIDLLARYMPPWVHLILSSRSAPALTTTRLLVTQQIGGLGTDDLRFRPAEAGDWLADAGVVGSPDEARSLVETTEGWITGLILRVAAGNGAPSTPSAGRVYAYLSSEVLERQPAHIQEFLLRAAVLPHLDAAACRRVLGVADPDLLLRWVYEQQLFLTANDRSGDDGATYRLHGLFREFLLTRLRAHAPQEWTALHGRAATYYAAQRDYGTALESLFTIADWPAAAALLGRIGPGALDAGHLESVERWLTAFPEAQRRLPVLLLLNARLCAAQSDLVAAGDLLARAEHALQAGDDPATYAEALALRARFAVGSNDGNGILAAAQQALAIPAATPLTQAEAQHCLGIGYTITGDPDRADAAFNAARFAYDALNDSQSLAMVLGSWGGALILWEKPRQAEGLLEQALVLVRAVGNRRIESRVLGNLASVYQYYGDFARAESCLAAAVDLAHTLRWHRVEAEVLVSRAENALELAGPVAALPHYLASAAIARHAAPPTWAVAIAGQARCLRLLGDTLGAIRIAQQGLEAARSDQMNHATAVCFLELGAALLAEAPTEALPLLREAETLLSAEGYTHDAVRVGAATASALFATGAYSGAQAALDRALHMAVGWLSQYDLVSELATRYGFPLLRQAAETDARPGALLTLAAHTLANLPATAGTGVTADVPDTPRLPIFEVYGLGQANVYQDGNLVAQSQWQTGTAKELFFYLIEQHDGARKEVILTAFWPDHSVEQANNTFHISLRRLRAALGATAVLAEDGIYRLNPQLRPWHDGTEALRYLDQARATADPAAAHPLWSAAAALLRGPFAEEFYHDWAEERRRFWAARSRETFSWLLDDAQQRGVFDEVVRWGQRLLALDPLDETAHARLMRAYTAGGHTTQAVGQYHEIQRLLDDEFGTPPGPEIQRLYQQLIHH